MPPAAPGRWEACSHLSWEPKVGAEDQAVTSGGEAGDCSSLWSRLLPCWYAHPGHPEGHICWSRGGQECVNSVWTIGHNMSFMHVCVCLVWVYDLSVYILLDDCVCVCGLHAQMCEWNMGSVEFYL